MNQRTASPVARVAIVVAGIIVGYGAALLSGPWESTRQLVFTGAVASIAVMLLAYVVYDLRLDRNREV